MLDLDEYQQIRLRRISIALIVAVLHTFFCFSLREQGYLRLTLPEFIILFGVFWLIHLLFPFLVITGLNRKLPDHNLTLPMLVWGITCLMITVYFADILLRPVLLMLGFLAFMFGWFQLTWRQFNFIAIYSVIVYAIIFFILSYRLPVFLLRAEILILLGYSLVTLCFSMVAAELASSRQKMQAENGALRKELTRLSEGMMLDEVSEVQAWRGVFDIFEQHKTLVEVSSAKPYAFWILMNSKK